MKHMKIVLVAAVILAAGCGAAIRGFPEQPRTSDAVYPHPDYLLGNNALEIYNRETDPLRKKMLRNEILDARMAEIDSKFADYERELYREGIGFGVGTDWTVLALTSSTAIVHGESAKTALAAVSTAVVGARTSFEKRALFDSALPTLIAQMQAQRETIRSSIRINEELAVEDYSIYSGLSDLQRFEFAGSIPGSLQSIAEDAGQKAKAAKDQIKDLRKASYIKTPASELLRKFWKPDGKNIDKNNEKKLKTWMKDNGFATEPGTITMFLYDDQQEEARKKAVRDLGLSK